MISRRHLTLVIPAAILLGCTNNQIDPQKLIDAIKTACGISVIVASAVALINAGVGMTLQAIVDAVCTGYQNAQASGNLKAAAPGGKLRFPVVINGKTIDVEVEPK